MKCVEKWFDNMCEWRMGNGERIRFWQDTWIGGSTFGKIISKIIPQLVAKTGDFE